MKGKRAWEMLKKNWGIAVVASFLVIILFFVLVRRDTIYVTIHDFLDATHVYLKMLKDRNLFWNAREAVPFLGGVDRNRMPSEYKLYNWFYMLFPAFPALVFGWFMRIVVSVIGFLSLSYVLFQKRESMRNLAAVCGLMYGIFPSFTVEGIGFASIPLLLALLIQIYRKPKKSYYILLLLYPILSSFVFFGIFICGYIVVFFIIDWVIHRKPKLRMLFAAFPLAAGYVLTEWRLFYVMFFSGTPSMRESYASMHIGWREAIQIAVSKFVNGEFHCDSLQRFFILPVCLIYLFVLNIGYIRKKEARMIWRDPFNWIFLWLVMNALIYPLEDLDGFQKIVEKILPPLSGFGFSRVLWFNPFLWHFAFFIILTRIGKPLLRNILWIIALIVVCIVPVQYNPIIYNIPGVYEAYVKWTGKEPHLSYQEFYSEELFDKIKKEIRYQGEWSVAYGMHPAILEYNEIKTLDGYFTLYPLSYKEKFREVIAPELAVDDESRSYYDDWGGRAYLFSQEIGYQPTRTMSVTEAELLINPEAFRKLNGKYIFSRVSITNAEELGLEEVGEYTDEGSPYIIYVYKMKNSER